MGFGSSQAGGGRISHDGSWVRMRKGFQRLIKVPLCSEVYDYECQRFSLDVSSNVDAEVLDLVAKIGGCWDCSRGC